MTTILAAAFVAVAGARAAETYEFNRYQVILDRSPFGPVSATEAAGAAAGFAANFGLVGIVYSNSVMPQVILHDKAANRSLFKAEGETIDDVKVVKIDLEARKVTLQKGLEKATLSFEQKPNTPGPALPAAVPQPSPGSPQGAPTPGAPMTPRRIPFRRSN